MRFAFLRATAVACVFTLAAFAQDSMTVQKLIEFVKSSIEHKLQDRDVAAYLAKCRLTQKLEDQTIEDLQTAGAGPRTVAALTHLADDSAKLPPPPPPPPPKAVPDGGPPPSEADQRRVIEAVREYALNYTESLPNFICLQVTDRYINRSYKPGDQAWSHQDKFSEQLNYVDHHENYIMRSHNDESTFGKEWKAVGGALSRGEWASLIQAVFDPATDTRFSWSRWGNLSGKRYYVFRYDVDKERSRETLDADGRKETPGFHGEVYVPFDENVVWRITVEPEPTPDFPMQDIKETLKYDYVKISDQRFLLPTSSEVVMREGHIGNKNDIAFRLYQKYSADTSIKFDDVDDPSDQPNDKPAGNPTDQPADRKKPPKQ
jgi:hypothetical protein